MRKKVIVYFVIALVIVGSVSTYYFVLPQIYCSGEGTTISYSPTFSFSMSRALGFYLSLKTPLGLESDSPGSKTIWLADDQGLDYNALPRIYNATGNSTALATADAIDASIQQWGGLYRYWNPAFETFGSYPNSTQVIQGKDMIVNASDDGYSINATEFFPNPSFNYSAYADQLAYRVLLFLHLGDYCAAESLFRTVTSMWNMSNGRGFVDSAFGPQDNYTYQSYNLALYVIAWKDLAGIPATQRFALGYQTTVGTITALMSNLQSSGGGVWTGYQFLDGRMVFGQGVSEANGETTSLFVLGDS